MNRYHILKQIKPYTLFGWLLLNLCFASNLAAQDKIAVSDTTAPVKEKPISASDTAAKPIGIKNADTLLPSKNALPKRKIVYMPRFEMPQNDTVHITGVVIIAICLDKEGTVISAKNVLGKSTVTNDDSINRAIQNALKYRFSPADNDIEDCREIKYNFKYM